MFTPPPWGVPYGFDVPVGAGTLTARIGWSMVFVTGEHSSPLRYYQLLVHQHKQWHVRQCTSPTASLHRSLPPRSAWCYQLLVHQHKQWHGRQCTCITAPLHRSLPAGASPLPVGAHRLVFRRWHRIANGVMVVGYPYSFS